MTRKPLLTPEEVAEILRVDAETVRRYLRDGRLGAYQIGREWRISCEDLELFLEAHRSRPRPSNGSSDDEV